jgi:hypothetical protein
MPDPALHDRLPPAEPGERMQRVRVGVTGLAAVVIVVAVATAVASGVRRSAEASNAVAPPPVVATVPAAPNSANPNSEPLAQLGAAPGSNPVTPAAPAKK